MEAKSPITPHPGAGPYFSQGEQHLSWAQKEDWRYVFSGLSLYQIQS